MAFSPAAVKSLSPSRILAAFFPCSLPTHPPPLLLPSLFSSFLFVMFVSNPNHLHRSIPDPHELPDIEPHPDADEEPAGDTASDLLNAAATLDERQMWLDDDPDLRSLEDTHVWQTLDWNQPEPVRPENRHRVLPEEDVRRVVALTCLVCTDACLFASTLQCTHMICVNCAESRKIQDCPICRAPKKVVATSHVGSLVLERADEIPDIRIAREPAPPERPLTQHPSGPEGENTRASGSEGNASAAPTTGLQSRVARNRNDDAINAILREDGHEDPDRYRAQLRRQNRVPRPRAVYVRHGLSRAHQEDVRRESEVEDDPDEEHPPADGHQEAAANTSPEDPDGRQTEDRSVLRSRAAEAAERRQAMNPGPSTSTEGQHEVQPEREPSLDEFDRLLLSQIHAHPSLPAGSLSQGANRAANDDESDDDEDVVLSQRSLRNRRRPAFIDEHPPTRGRKRTRRQ